MTDIIVVGAGGFGREVLDVIDSINVVHRKYRLRGVVDDNPSQTNLELLEHRKIAYLGATEDLLSSKADPCAYVVGIGGGTPRRILADKFDSAGFMATTLVHPSATMGYDVEVGRGSVICAGVRLTTNIRLGQHVHLNLNVTVGHDTVIGDFVSANPLASISGDCVIEDGVQIGVSGVVLNGLTVGSNSVVGGSACVVRDVPPDVVVKGVPAK